MDVKIRIGKLIESYQEYNLKPQLLFVPNFLFLLFSVNFNKQNTLANNNQNTNMKRGKNERIKNTM